MNIADLFYDLALDDGSYVYGRLDALPQLTFTAGDRMGCCDVELEEVMKALFLNMLYVAVAQLKS